MLQLLDYLATWTKLEILKKNVLHNLIWSFMINFYYFIP